MASDKNPIKVDLGFSTVPKENTCDGRDLSPKINLSGLVAPYVALIVEDPDSPFRHLHPLDHMEPPAQEVHTR